MEQKKPWLCILLSSLVLAIGCQPKNALDSQAQTPAAEPGAVSSVPLRVLIVNRGGDYELLKRQWLSVSEQPLEIRTMSMDEFLGGTNCDCDTVIYPARLLGTLVQRGWLKKVIEESTVSGKDNVNYPDPKPIPKAWTQQTVYAGAHWAKSLGCAMPVLLVDRNSEFDAQHGPQNWNDVLNGPKSATERPASAPAVDLSPFDPAKWDADALVDRFLTIANSLSPRNTNYGLLFEMQTMKPLVASDEFLEAARILQKMAAQSERAVAAAGSWQDAWNWMSQDHQRACTVGLMGEIAIAGDAVTSIDVTELPVDSAVAKKEPRTMRHWNTGGGLLVSLSEDCRQSARSENLIDWLCESTTRDALAKSIQGIDADSPVFGTDSSAWKVTQLQQRMASQGIQPPELRFPGTQQYRAALAVQLKRILAKEVEARAALDQVAAEWDRITDSLGRMEQRTHYEYSLIK